MIMLENTSFNWFRLAYLVKWRQPLITVQNPYKRLP